MAEKKITKEGLESLVEKFINNAEEERDLALDRYRRQDEQMQSPEDFVLQGKQTVEYLKTASERSNALLTAAKLVKDVVYASESNNSSSGDFDDDMKRFMIEQMKNND